MNSTELDIVVKVKDEASQGFKQLSTGLKKESENMSKSFSMTGNSVASLQKLIVGGSVAAGAALGAFLYSSAKAAAEAQVQMARVNTTLDSMIGTTIEVSTGLFRSTTSMKLTGIEAEQMKNKIEAANISIREQKSKLNDLERKLDKGSITQKEYNLQVASAKNKISELNLSIQGYNEKLGETQTSQEVMKKSLQLTADQVSKARVEILKLADANIKLGFDDEDTAESLSKLFQRTGDLTEATKLNILSMDLARSKNIDLAQATDLVGQVLAGNGRVLKQFGIELDDSLAPLDALRELQKRVSGQADAFSQTFQGQMQILSVNFQNIKETIGSALIDALAPFIQQFTAWLNDPKTKENFAKWTADFQSWATVIIPVVIDVFKLWAGILEGIYNTIIKIGDEIGSLISKLGQVRDKAQSDSKAMRSGLLGKLVGKASGGAVSAMTPYMVGEKGPELFIPGRSGSIVPNNSMQSGSNISISLNGNFYGTDESTAEKFADTIAGLIGQQMKLRTI